MNDKLQYKKLELKNVFSGYGKIDILSDVSFSVEKGETLAVIGPNGCGKTTLLKTLARLLPHRGQILLEGQEISVLPGKILARKAALLSQSAGVYFPYSVYDTVALGRYPHLGSILKILSAEDKEIIRSTLIKLELWDEKDRLINELSGGQLQRVLLARVLVQDPDIILLDEPTNHLDLRHQVELLDYLLCWAREKDRTVVAVLHDLNLARRFAENAVLLCRGLLVSAGSIGEVLSGDAINQVYGLDIRAFMQQSLGSW